MQRIRRFGRAIVLVAVMSFTTPACKPGSTEAQESLSEKPDSAEPERSPYSESDFENVTDWSDEQMQRFVRWYLFDSTKIASRFDADLLAKATEERGQQIALEILEDPDQYNRLSAIADDSWGRPSAPFVRACWMLERNGSERAMRALAPFLEDDAATIRQAAAYTIANNASPSALPYLKQAIRDSDEIVWEAALLGLAQSLERQSLPRETTTALFEEVRGAMERESSLAVAALALYLLDPERAKEYILSDNVFFPDSSSLRNSLDTLSEEQDLVAREKLLALLDDIESEPLTPVRKSNLGAVLQMLGLHRKEEDRALLERYLDGTDEALAEDAIQGLLRFHDIEDFGEGVFGPVDTEKLNDPQRYCHQVAYRDSCIRNGGLSSCFYADNMDPELLDDYTSEWKDTGDGYEAMGMPKRAKMFREAMEIIVKDGLLIDPEDGRVYFPGTTEAEQARLDELDKLYYACEEPVWISMMRYVLAHPESFR